MQDLEKVIIRLAQINCSNEQIAAYCDISLSELDKYSDLIAKGRNELILEISNEVKKLASMFISEEKIAAYFRMGVVELRNRYADDLDEGRAIGEVWIAKQQFQKSSSGDNEMLRLLMRQRAGLGD